MIGQVGKHLRQMLGEGIDPSDVRRGLSAWHAKGQHPSTLPSFVNEAMNARPAGQRRSTTEERVAQAMSLADYAAAKDAEDAELGVGSAQVIAITAGVSAGSEAS